MVHGDDTSEGTACRKKGCDPATGECALRPVATLAACDDGNPCTTGNRCDGKGSWFPGTDKGWCHDDAGCAAAEDGDPCKGTRSCDKGKAPYQCRINPATIVHRPNVNDTDCLKSTCDPKTGACAIAAQASATCDDGNGCTDDGCDAKTGCVHLPDQATCSDGDACTVGDGCKAGKCAPGKPKQCDDAQPCTDDGCAPKTGRCAHKPNGDACDDGDACTNDWCDAKLGCAHKGRCDDGNPCTTDTCSSKTVTCTHASVTKGSKCAMGDCRAGGCVTPVVGISAGGSHTCALKTDGTFACWGYDSSGQLGKGSASSTAPGAARWL